jgi:hypothetical protein
MNGATPRPSNEMTVEPPLALCSIVNIAVFAPGLVGRKPTRKTQLLPRKTVPPQSDDTEKSPRSFPANET